MAATKPQATAPVKAPAKGKPAPVPYRGPPLLGPYPAFPGMAPAQFTKMTELCGPRWVDLLFHLPRSVLDRSAAPTIATAPVGERATMLLKVIKRPSVFGSLRRGGKKIPLVIELADDSGSLRAIYFNVGGWLERAYPQGGTVVVSGKVEEDSKGKKLIHPDVWTAGKLPEDAQLKAVAKVWPLYPLTAGLPQGWVNRAVQHALAFASEHPPPEWLPAALLARLKLPAFTEALQAAHNPENEADIVPTTPARMRLALDEFLATQLALQHARATTRFQPGIAHGQSQAQTDKLLASLPFALTGDQQQALDDIATDLATPRPMLRLLQGDVGAGKTLVALAALCRVMENGQQGVLMAPTEILARQLYANAVRYLQPLGFTVGLLVGSLPAAQKKKLKQHVRDGFVNLLVGTHALVQDDVTFDRLGLAVIDEQHRFGVRQRMALSANQSLPPDLLLMTATPIPRTLALTAYGDMDVSVLREKPPGRTPIQTVAIPDARLNEVARGLERVIAQGQQVYWVCPLVDESEDTDLAAATARAAWLAKVYGDKVGVLHGKMKAAEKDAVMARFQAGELAILVSTTVIEVGVDVPNATLMVIEHAERFGLSQLHQLRGRVGRGAAKSQCVLLYSPPLTPFAEQRLDALRQSDDGFELAEKDLELRGPGEVLGTRQSGQIATRLADLHHHRELLPLARDAAQALLASNLSPQQRGALTLLLQMFDQTAAAAFLRGG
ncbi:MAG: ATP-dependent DNA helicase RecG [Pseudomonadaceae bacterium]|nr:ATP-dependent DNA helicase RecG [Pseudomonadaceae bacterium]